MINGVAVQEVEVGLDAKCRIKEVEELGIKLLHCGCPVCHYTGQHCDQLSGDFSFLSATPFHPQQRSWTS